MDVVATKESQAKMEAVDFQIDPSRYRHWRLAFDGPVATLTTRNGIEDASAHSGLKFLAACNGTTAGGGYELALACDEIILVDDRSSAVSLPELPLLGVLPGTGGSTRVTDKRKVRRDHADSQNLLLKTPWKKLSLRVPIGGRCRWRESWMTQF